MKDISQIDSNLKIGETINKPDVRFYDPRQEPFKIYGLVYEGDRFRRMPENVAMSVNEGVYELHANCAGGRVRFRTDSPYAAISCVMPGMCKLPHCATTGTTGFDLYEDDDYLGSFIPPFGEDGYESVVDLGDSRMRELTINFPTYTQVKELYVGLAEGAEIAPPRPYKLEKPVVYYGSSITQGGCASRPGSTYQAIVSRKFDCDYINLGFSGSARGEPEMAEYIKGLDMSAFVYDYDHNAPTVQHLRDTHEKMFRAIRQAHPNIPVIMMTRPKYHLTEKEAERRKIVETTYLNALRQGDENVYFLDNRALTAFCGNDGTVDNCHPNDWGFASMAMALIDLMEENEILR